MLGIKIISQKKYDSFISTIEQYDQAVALIEQNASAMLKLSEENKQLKDDIAKLRSTNGIRKDEITRLQLNLKKLREENKTLKATKRVIPAPGSCNTCKLETSACRKIIVEDQLYCIIPPKQKTCNSKQ